MKITIIPDIHTRFAEAEAIIDKESPTKVIFLGDYFDAFDDSLEIIHEVGVWLKESMTKPDRIHLLGNHDLAYLDENYPCSGFSQGKLWAIHNSGVKLSKLEYYCWAGDWLCTHSGLSNDFYNAYKKGNETVDNFLQRYSSDDQLKSRLYDCSPNRGGRDAFSGIVWCDFGEFNNIPNVKQIFGHTKGNVVRTIWNEKEKSQGICLDTALHNYAVLEDNKMEIRPVE